VIRGAAVLHGAVDPLARTLNPEQLAAVRHGEGPLLILAGAGSGKTRVLTHRIAHLLHAGLARPGEILAVTFTNKAAGELRERVLHLVGPGAEKLWVSTFHAFGARLLRRESDALGLDRAFAIYDDADQLAALKRACQASDVDLDKAKQILGRIDRWKNAGLLPPDVQPEPFDVPAKTAARVYARYQQELQSSQAVDFGDLIVRSLELLTKHADLGEKYSQRFRYILVDEFQDTNPAQYQLLLALAKTHGNLCVVGDDDQSIYRWRGAEVSNIIDFPKQFPACRVVKLEQNYRSSANILAAAHAVIAKNERRADKKLWTQASAGEPLRVLAAEDERDEASQIARGIHQESGLGTSFSEMAVFYRQNAQSRVLEDALRAARVPYRVVRGRSFYDRAEVKDVAAYLRLCINPRSDGDILRIINTPARGIGETTVERLRASAQRAGGSLWEALLSLEHDGELPGAAKAKLVPFRNLLTHLQRQAAADPSAAGNIERVLDESGMEARFQLEGDEGADRIDNLRELLGAARDFDRAWEETQALAASGEAAALAPQSAARTAAPDDLLNPNDLATASEQRDQREAERLFALDDEGKSAVAQWPQAQAQSAPHDPAVPDGRELPDLRAALAAAAPDLDDAGASADTPLLGFLEQLSLVGDADAGDEGEKVSLMTLHAAKGLEFDAVWLTGMEERVFPGARALGQSGPEATGIENPDELAEERRLCYVGMTRARKRLNLTLARCRALFGELRFNPPSRFLREIPPALATGLAALDLSEPGSDGGGFRGGGGYRSAGGWQGGAGGGFSGGQGGRGGYGQGGGRLRDEFDQRPHSDDNGPRFAPPARRPFNAGASGSSSSASRPPPARSGAFSSSGNASAANSASATSAAKSIDGFSRGTRVRHPSFGVGAVEELEGTGTNLKLTVRFPPGVGLKKVLARFLERI